MSRDKGATMTTSRFIMRAALAALLVAAMPGATLAQSEENEVNAFSVVRGKGTGFRIADKLNTFVGTLEGMFFVEGSEGPVQAGTIICSAAIEMKTEDRSYTGSGRCLITGEEGGQVFAQYTCEGYFLIGCSGTFTLTGGTERFAGVTGGGPVTMRTSVGKLKDKTEVSQSVEVEGIMFWRDLKYKLP